MIRATGIKNGRALTVEYNDGYMFNGGKNFRYEAEIELLLREGHPVGGTYYPEVGDPLNLIGVLGGWFFDGPADVATDLEVAIPGEEGVIY